LHKNLNSARHPFCKKTDLSLSETWPRQGSKVGDEQQPSDGARCGCAVVMGCDWDGCHVSFSSLSPFFCRDSNQCECGKQRVPTMKAGAEFTLLITHSTNSHRICAAPLHSVGAGLRPSQTTPPSRPSSMWATRKVGCSQLTAKPRVRGRRPRGCNSCGKFVLFELSLQPTLATLALTRSLATD
jgi:hypothetical protein